MTTVVHREERQVPERKVRSCGCTSTCGCETGPGCAVHGDLAAQGLERTRYYPRQIVTPDDLTQDQIYFRDKLRRHNRLLHGWGIVCGLVVTRCEPDDGEDCRVLVSSGFALDPFGNELVLPRDKVLDLCKEDLDGAVACVPETDPWCRPVDATPAPCPQYLAVRHVERPGRPVHAPHGCSCRDASCENSRIADGLEFKLLADKPTHYDDGCEWASPLQYCRDALTCPDCPATGWVILAEVCMEGSSIAELDPTGCRRHVYSMAKYCIDCSDVRGQDYYTYGEVKRFVGSATTQPDAVLTVNAVVDGQASEISVAVAEADIADKSAVEVKDLLDKVVLLDAEDSTVQPFNAGLLISHSAVEADWKFEGVDDLELRLRTPVIQPAEHDRVVAEVGRLLDRDGQRKFEAALANPARIEELDVEAITGIGPATATVLRTAGVARLADLRGVDVSKLPDVGEQANRALAEVRVLLDGLDRPRRGRA